MKKLKYINPSLDFLYYDNIGDTLCSSGTVPADDGEVGQDELFGS